MKKIVCDSEGRILLEGEEKIYKNEIVGYMDENSFNVTASKLVPGQQYTYTDKAACMAKKFAFINGETIKGRFLDSAKCNGHTFREVLGRTFIDFVYEGRK
jgi:hypothetical protein